MIVKTSGHTHPEDAEGPNVKRGGHVGGVRREHVVDVHVRRVRDVPCVSELPLAVQQRDVAGRVLWPKRQRRSRGHDRQTSEQRRSFDGTHVATGQS